MTDQYEIGKPVYKSHYDKAALNKPSRLTGRSGVSIHAAAAHDDARIIIGASDIKAPAGNIEIKAHSDIVLDAGQNNAYTFLKTKGKSGKIIRKTKFTSTRDHLIMPAPVELTANGITLQAGSNIEANTTRFNAPAGNVTLVAGEELQLLAAEGIHAHELSVQKNRRLIGIKVSKSNYIKNELNETKLPVRIIAQTASTRSGWDTVLEGTEFQTTLSGANIQTGVGAKARSDAKIILKGIVNRVSTEEHRESNATVWQSMAGKGEIKETLKLPSFEGPTPPTLTAPGGYIADIPQGRLKTEIEKLAKQPEYAYLKQLQTANNIDWRQIQLAYDKWEYKQEGLTPAGAAIIGLAVAVGTGGIGASLIGAAEGSTSAAMANAAFTSLATQASISIVNNKGDIGKTLKELSQSSTIKRLATDIATAGAANKIGTLSALKWSQNATINKLTINLATATSGATIHTAINGGSLKDNLERGILSALIQTAHGEIASQIKGLDLNYIAHKIAHAITGCAAAVANRGKCQDGAIGSAVGEIIGEQLLNGRDPSSLTQEERNQIIAYTRLLAGAAAGFAGGDVNVAADSAKVAVENNGLLDRDGKTPDEREKERKIKKYGTNLNEIANRVKIGNLILTRDLANYIYQLNQDPEFTIEVNAENWNVYIPKDAEWFPNPKNKKERVASGRIPYSDISRWSVHGNVSVIKGVDGRYRMVEEDYDFEMHIPKGSISSKLKSNIRNIETIAGNPGRGTKFKVKFKGYVNVIQK